MEAVSLPWGDPLANTVERTPPRRTIRNRQIILTLLKQNGVEVTHMSKVTSIHAKKGADGLKFRDVTLVLKGEPEKSLLSVLVY